MTINLKLCNNYAIKTRYAPRFYPARNADVHTYPQQIKWGGWFKQISIMERTQIINTDQNEKWTLWRLVLHYKNVK
jgi:hypothetical protein